jgi:Rrf2 family iron-sulfur cluster assembly transcriptional regulator
MSVFFSRQCEYALQAVMYIALKPDNEMTSIRELSMKLGIPYHFLAKILQDLTRKKLLTSLKGSTGGYMLAMPKETITPFHIVDAIDGSSFLDSCLLGFPICSSENPCSVHKEWEALRERLHSMLKETNIYEAAMSMKKPQYSSR